MSIKQTRYVDIASAVIGASTAPMRKLTARIFQQTLKFQQESTRIYFWSS